MPRINRNPGKSRLQVWCADVVKLAESSVAVATAGSIRPNWHMTLMIRQRQILLDQLELNTRNKR